MHASSSHESPPAGPPAEQVAPVDRRSTPQLVAEGLVRFIRANHLRKGDRLPSTLRLARMLGVSLASLREGLKELEAYGVLAARHGRGIFVASDPAEVLLRANPYTGLYPLQPFEVLDLMDARRLIEAETARLAAARSRPAHLTKMRALLDLMRACLDRPQEFIRHDVAFHMTIAESSNNGVYPRLLSAVRETFLIQQRMAVELPGAAERACHYHERVYEALVQRDGAAAAQAMTEHLEDIKRNLQRALETADGR